MRIIRLYGHLGQRFGRQHRLDVRSPAEAIRALCANFAGFAQAVADGQWRVLVGGKAQSLDQMHDPLAADISIVPAVAGAGGFGKVVLGAALIAFSVMNPTFGLLPFTSGPLAGMSIGSIAGNIGLSLALGGVSQMLFKPPKPPKLPAERPENMPSYAFNGVVNTTAQGNPVPVCYGRMRVGSQVISAGLHSEAMA